MDESLTGFKSELLDKLQRIAHKRAIAIKITALVNLL